jgi:2,3-dihydroxyphenylpropionate 1,2-dioxygenase
VSVALCAMSHSPLKGVVDPEESVVRAVESTLEDARRFVDDFAPDLVVAFAPDHYNGFFYEVMPPFCIGASATSIGDYGLPTGPVRVDAATSRTVAAGVLERGVDVAFSERMDVDHGLVQPLLRLFGSLDAVPIVPVFINCVADPLGPAMRSMELGRAIGDALAEDDRRILFLASGGLSHDPPVPQLAGASPEVAERITVRGAATESDRELRESRTVAAARAFASGSSDRRDLNPEWDAEFLLACREGELERIAAHPTAWFTDNAGNSSHEVRTWLAAYGALSRFGPYQVTSTFYRPVPEWFAGFGVTTATPVRVAVTK